MSKLRELRKKSKLTLKQVAAKTGICIQTLSRYELGQREPNIRNLQILSRVFEVPIEQLL